MFIFNITISFIHLKNIYINIIQQQQKIHKYAFKKIKNQILTGFENVILANDSTNDFLPVFFSIRFIPALINSLLV